MTPARPRFIDAHLARGAAVSPLAPPPSSVAGVSGAYPPPPPLLG